MVRSKQLSFLNSCTIDVGYKLSLLSLEFYNLFNAENYMFQSYIYEGTSSLTLELNTMLAFTLITCARDKRIISNQGYGL